MHDYEKAEALRVKLDEVIPQIYRRKSKNMFLGIHPRNTFEQYDNDQEWSKQANPSYYLKRHQRDLLDLELLRKGLNRSRA
jgi:hypothetical protein